MNTNALFRLSLLALLVGACSSPAASIPATAVLETPTPMPVVTAEAAPSATPEPSRAAVCQPGPGEVAVVIDGRANLFGAGHETPPAPAGGGAGVLPAVVALPNGQVRLVTLPCTAGATNCCAENPGTGPAGDTQQSTDVQSHGGIAGLVMDRRAMFLAGVFLSDETPADPAPERLDFSEIQANFDRLEPELHQTFYVGTGKDKVFVAPEGATRLYLGFVDSYGFLGRPGWYDNNRGALEATVLVTVE